MVSITNLITAIFSFTERSIIPLLPMGKRVQGLFILGFIGYKAKEVNSMLVTQLTNDPTLKALGVTTVDGSIDIDMLESVLCKVLDGLGGKYTFKVSDFSALPMVDKLIFLEDVVFDKNAVKNIVQSAKEL